MSNFFPPITDILGTWPTITENTVRVIPRPTKFLINFRLDEKGVADELLYIVGDPSPANIVRFNSSYRIYFVTIDQAGANIGAWLSVYGVFQKSQQIASAAAPTNGGLVTIHDSTHVGRDGWFFATAADRFGVESDFVGPIRNPWKGSNDKRVPSNVLSVTADKFDGGTDPWGRQLIGVATTAKVPPQSDGVSVVEMENPGTDYTHDFQVIFTTADGDTTGHGAVGTAHVMNGGVNNVEVMQAGSDYTLPPVVQFDSGDGIGAQARSILTASGSFSAYQIYLLNYFSSGDMVEGPSFAAPTFGALSVNYGTIAHGDFILYPDSPPVHSVRLHFVSLSQTGTRQTDPRSAPYVEFSTGILL